MSIQDLAKTAYDQFETAYRDDDDSRYVRVKDGAPEWIQDLCHEAHGSMLPDDWRYECIQAALEAISHGADDDDGAFEFADGYVDVYNSDLLAWLGSHSSRVGYVDDAAREVGLPADEDIMSRIRLGQYMEAAEVYGLVYGFLTALAEEEEED